MARTKLRQLPQIDNSQSYNDGYTSMNSAGAAEPALGDGSLEQDLNVLRSLMKQEKGAVAHWYTTPANTLSNLDTGTGLAGTSAPVYSSALDVTQGESLTAAVGHLDQYLGNVKGGFGSDNIAGVVAATTAKAAIDALDAYAAATQGELDRVETALGAGVNSNGTYSNTPFASSNYLNGNTSITQDLLDLDTEIAALSISAGDGMTSTGSLQAGTLTFNVVGTAGQITALADSVKVADAFSKTDFTSFTVSSSSGLLMDGAGASHLSTSSGNMLVSAVAGNVQLQSSSVFVDTASKVHLTTGLSKSFQYQDGAQVDGYYMRSDASGFASWHSVADQLAGTDLSSTGTQLNVTTTLQTAYNHGTPSNPDIQVAADDTLDFILGTGTSTFNVQSNDGYATLSVGNDYVRMLDTRSGRQTVLVTDGYVQIDGYLTVTGDTIQINTQVTDADHWLVQPALSSQAAVTVMPRASTANYSAHLLDLYDGYNGTLQVYVDHAGDAYFNKAVQITSSGTFQLAGNSAADGYYLRSDASGNATWHSVSDQLAGNGLSSTGTTLNVNVVPNETIINADRVGFDPSYSKTNYTQYVAQSSGGMSLTTTAGDIALSSAGALAFNGAAASHMTVASANLTLSTTTSGNVIANAAGALNLDAAATSHLSTSAGNMLVSAAAGDVQLQSATVKVNSASKLFVTTGANSFQYQDGNQAANKYLVSDASGNAAWSQITTSQVNTAGLTSTNYISNGTTDSAALSALDAQVFVDTAAIAALSVTAGDGMTQTGSLQAGTLVFNVVGTAGQITALADSVKVADAFSKTDFTSFTVSSSSGLLMDGAGASHLSTSSGTMTVSGATDAYFSAGTGEFKLKDNRSAPTSAVSNYFRLSTSTAGGTDFSTSLRTAAASLGYLSAGATGELGIIDAINTLSTSSSATIEKAVFVIGASDGRLSSTGGGLTSNILSLNTTGGGPDRGSLELTPSADGYGSDFRPARDLEVHVNGVLQLADASQKSAASTPTDDYFLASNDVDKLVFSFMLKAGDVVTVVNHKAAPGENVDAGWNLVV